MKKTLATIAVLIAFSPIINAQITLDRNLTDFFNLNDGHFFFVNFSSSGKKIVTWDYSIRNHDYNIEVIRLFNTDYTLWKTIFIPNYPEVYRVDGFYLLSEALFDTDPNNIELVILYIKKDGDRRLEIIREDGSLLKRIEGGSSGSIGSEVTFETNTFLDADNSFKLPISIQKSDGTEEYEVYTLPGTYPCQPSHCDIMGGTTRVKPANFQQDGGMLGNPIPNPSSNTVTINYQLPSSISSGQLYLLNAEGKLIQEQPVNNTGNKVTIDVSGLNSGVYFYQIETAKGNSSTKKMLVVK